MPMLHIESGKLYCTHCQFSYTGGPEGVVIHPRYKDIGPNISLFSAVIGKDFGFLTRIRNCPLAGHAFHFPEAVRIMDEETP